MRRSRIRPQSDATRGRRGTAIAVTLLGVVLLGALFVAGTGIFGTAQPSPTFHSAQPAHASPSDAASSHLPGSSFSWVVTVTYAEATEFLFALRRFGWRPGLATVERLLALVGDPQAGLPCVHVGGSNGKGSTAAMLAASASKSVSDRCAHTGRTRSAISLARRSSTTLARA